MLIASESKVNAGGTDVVRINLVRNETSDPSSKERFKTLSITYPFVWEAFFCGTCNSYHQNAKRAKVATLASEICGVVDKLLDAHLYSPYRITYCSRCAALHILPKKSLML